MHLVFLNQYYPPDAAPTGVMLAGLGQGLLDAGHEVTVLCAAGGYAAAGNANVNHSPSNGGYRTEDACHEEPMRRAQAPPAATTRQPPTPPRLRIIRIRATKFGRGTFAGKLLDYASYYLGVGWKLLVLRPRPDRIVALTTPPYLSVMARLGSKIRGADHAHWVMDLYPDVMAAHGMCAANSISYRILAGVARWGFGGKRCAAVLTLGPDMAQRVGQRMGGGRAGASDKSTGRDAKDQAIADPSPEPPRSANGQAPSATWVPLWSVGDVVPPQPSEAVCPYPPSHSALAMRRQRGWGEHEVVAMYSGNMGLGHRFGEFLEAARQLAEEVGRDGTGRADPAFRFVFFGRGKRRGEVEQFVRDCPAAGIGLYDYAPAEELAAHLQSADVHLASLDTAWTGTMVPSKVQGIFGVGRPVIFIGSADSSIGRWIDESGGGWVVAPGDVSGVLAALAEARDPAVRAARGNAAHAFAIKHFDQATNVVRMVAVLGGV